MTVEFLVPDTDAVPRTYAIVALRYFHQHPETLTATPAWDDWRTVYADHLADVPLVVHDGTDELWGRNPDTGLWTPLTEAQGTLPSGVLDSILRTLLSRMVKLVLSDAGPKQYLIAATPSLLSNMAREIVTVLKEAGRVVMHLGIQTLTATPLPCPVTHILPAANGLLDVITHTLHPYTPDIFVTSVFPTAYRPELAPRLADWSYLHNTRDSIRTDTDQQMTLLQELMGYAMGFDRSIRGAIAFRGVSGSGKGSTLALLRRTVGEAFQTFTLRALGSDTEVGRSAIIQRAASARIMADLDAVSPSTLRSQSLTADIKTISDFDDVTWRVSRAAQASTVRWGAMMIMATNELVPRWTDTSAAIANRFYTITFDHGADHRKRETGIAEDAAYRESLNYGPDHPELFLLWAAEGLARVVTNGRFTVSDQSAKLQAGTKLHVVPIETWLEEQIEFTGDPADFIASQQMLLAMWGWLHDQEISFAKVKPALQTVPRLAREAGMARGKIVSRSQRRLAGYKDLSDRSDALEGSPAVRGLCGLRFRAPLDYMQMWDALQSVDQYSYKTLAITREGRVPVGYNEFARMVGAPVDTAIDIDFPTLKSTPPYRTH